MSWVDQYRVVLGNKGISQKYALWYVKRVDAFMRYAGYTDPGGLTREIVEKYFAEIGRKKTLENWQFCQVVDAMRILVLDTAALEWGKEVDWEFWRGTQREVDKDHATLLREGSDSKMDFSQYNLNAHAPAPDGLADTLTRIRNTIRQMHYSVRTEQSYLLWCEKFLRFNSCGSPDQLTSESVKVYMAYLALKRRVAVNTQKQALNSVMFMFQKVFGMKLGNFSDFVRAKRPQRLPVVLSMDEVRKLFEQLEGAQSLMVGLMYGGGL